MPEVAGNAAELFDPWDPDSIADVIARLSRDDGRRRELRRLSALRCEDMTVKGAGESIWKAVHRARRSFEERTAVGESSR
jgi:hypothetical protein